MRIGVTVRFHNSYFSGSVPQVACALAKALTLSGHDVTLLYPSGEPSWFIDAKASQHKSAPWSNDQRYDTIVEVVWSLSPEDRAKCAKQVIGFVHHPPIFHDMESSVYSWNPAKRSFKNVSILWTYDFYSKQDVQYLEFLSGVPVQQVPYVWDPDVLDSFVAENNIPSWSASATRISASIPAGTPPTLSWCARILESNFSNTSHCIIPLNIVSQIRLQNDPIRFCVHNGEVTASNDFFKANIARNLLLPDISGNMVPRVRLPDLMREKSFFIAHQRFRPMKSYLLDAMYLGIPMVHNCEILKNMGAPYYYELNQILQATAAWKIMNSDYNEKKGFFLEQEQEQRKAKLRARFSPIAVSQMYTTLLQTPVKRIVATKVSVPLQKELRIAFANMWDQFQPNDNFFLYLLKWVGSMHNIRVVHDAVNPNLVFFGPLSNGEESKYPGIPKVYYTGENAPPNKHNDTFLNLGFQYDTSSDYVRLPIWVTEINWWGADPNKMVNPRPVSLQDAMRVDPASLDASRKFCAFVATNPKNPNRNTAFQILDKWKGVASGGRLFCNLPDGPIPAGLGGGGGELAKVEFYKQYKYVIAYENSSAPGYTTEKLFHAKVAGAVPIYWGDPFVDRDFDSAGFLNANQVATPQDLMNLVDGVSEERWRRMAAVPALSAFKKRWCEHTMEAVAKKVFQRILDVSVTVEESAWSSAEKFLSASCAPCAPNIVPNPRTTPPLALSANKPKKEQSRIFVTAANAKFVEAAVNVVNSLKQYEPTIPKIVYVWPDVTEQHQQILRSHGATEIRMLPTNIGSETPWPDFWEPQHFAWKLWVHNNILNESAPGTCILYLDAATIITSPLERIWSQIDSQGIFLIDDPEQTNERWCHPVFCKNLQVTEEELKVNQLWAGCVGMKKGSPYNEIAKNALHAAKTRETIVGEKWQPYSATCLGHRHDQSILSILTQRAKCPRVPLKEFYNDRSLRAAQQLNVPLYVHRGQFRAIVPFAEGIDEAYVINLDRRQDRLERFKKTHAPIKDRIYRWKAVDGLALSLTPQLVECFKNNDFGWKKAVMGCALSHLGLWEKLANDNVANSYMILEDDVRFSERWLIQWAQSAKNVPSDADVIYLGGVLPPNKPVLPMITEQVNKQFARVAKNTAYGSSPRRYFHFCNYSYILTKRGAQKLVTLIKERGIFTSGDHMIVNHGDELLNIYFTTPLMSTCFQEDDPVYQKSEFNNFQRIDNFDSDLWNNNERFTKEDVERAVVPEPVAKTQPSPALSPASVSGSVSESQPPKPPAKDHESHVRTWNTFLRHIALKDSKALKDTLGEIFAIWRSLDSAEFQKNIAWFRIFEQMVQMKHASLLEHSAYIVELIRSSFPGQQDMWANILHVLGAETPNTARILYHRPEVNPATLLEAQWFNDLFSEPLAYRPYSDDIPDNAIILHQIVHGKKVENDLFALLGKLYAEKKRITLIHISDEFGSDDIRMYNSPAVKKILRNYWRPDVSSNPKVQIIPLGYANDRQAKNKSENPSFSERTNLWGFAGSLDRVGRSEALAILRSAGPYEEYTKENWSLPGKLGPEQYTAHMRNVKFVPCFRGSRALESYRFYEALEHGAIPIYVPSESQQSKDEYAELYGKHPFLGFPSWQKAAEMLPILAKQPQIMEKHREALRQWWSEKKTELRASLTQRGDIPPF